VENFSQFKFDFEIALAAARRWSAQKDTLRDKERAEASGQYDALDSKERLAKRANRLLRAARAAMPEESFIRNEGLRAIASQRDLRAEDMSNVLMERIIGKTNDILSIRFFDAGKKASQAVCRIVLKLGNGRLGFGTGFMVSPSLLLTNHHVFGSAEEARRATAQFRYEPGEQGDVPVPVEFEFRPDRFFLNNKDYDFALVAVEPTTRNGTRLSDFGYCPLIAAEGKIIAGEPVNIIQHPRGEPKQVVVRENKLLDLPKPTPADPSLDRYAQYVADTQPGSSGSPVFNDQWEVIALHHSGVPKVNERGQLVDDAGNVIDQEREPQRIVWIGNEGIRVSRLMQVIAGTKLTGEAEQLRLDLLKISQVNDAPQPEVAKPTRRPIKPAESAALTEARLKQPMISSRPETGKDGSMSITLPLTITVSLGGGGGPGLVVCARRPTSALPAVWAPRR
jgi:endonuclease G